MDDVLTTGRQAIEARALTELQRRMDKYETGVRVLRVKLEDVHPALEVVDAFREVSAAFEEKNRLVNERFPEIARRALAPGGVVYLRTDDRNYFEQMIAVFAAGSEVSIAELVAAAFSTGGATAPAAPPSAAGVGALAGAPTSRPLREEVEHLDRIFQTSLDECDAPAAVRAILTLEETIQAWSRDTDQSDALAQARSALRAAIVCLGEMAVGGSRDPAELVAPFVEALLSARLRAREARDWAAADGIRDRLLAAGIELRDTPDGTSWELRRAEPVG